MDNKMTAEQALEWIDVYGFALDTQKASDCIEVLRQALSAPRVPDGWKLVPVEPTSEMLADAWDALRSDRGEDFDHLRKAGIAYRSMLAASPEPVSDSQQVIADPSPADDMETQLAAKDWVIGNMQLKDSEQEAEIADLRAEVEALRGWQRKHRHAAERDIVEMACMKEDHQRYQLLRNDAERCEVAVQICDSGMQQILCGDELDMALDKLIADDLAARQLEVGA